MTEKEEKVIVYTDAPEAYDYGRTKTIEDRTTYRVVEIDTRYHAEIQVARYRSGMYWATEDEEKAQYIGKTRKAEF